MANVSVMRMAIGIGPLAAAVMTASCAASPAPGQPGGGAVGQAQGAAGNAGDIHPHATMLRFPAVSATHIVFVYANDIWLVPPHGRRCDTAGRSPGDGDVPQVQPGRPHDRVHGQLRR